MTQNSRGLAAGLRPGRGARGTLEGRTLASARCSPASARPPLASARLRRSLAAALAALAAALPGACGDVGGSSDPRPGDLLVADIDAGAAQPDGERLGVIFRARPEGDGYKLSTFAEDPRWREPADVLVLPDRCVLVLDQQWKPDDGPARGAIFKTYWAGGPVTLLWSDTRARQLVAMAWSAREHLLYVSDREANPSELRDAAGAPANTGCVFAIPLTSDDTAGDATIAAAGPELVTPGALTVLHDGRVLLMDADANPHHALLADGRAATPGELFELKDGKLLPLLVPDVTVSPIALIERDLRTDDELRQERHRRAEHEMHIRFRIDTGPPREGHQAVEMLGPESGGPGDQQQAEQRDVSAEEGDSGADEDDPELVPPGVERAGVTAHGAPAEPEYEEAPSPKLSLFLVDANEGTASGVMGDGALFRVDLARSGASLHKLLDSLSVGRPRAMLDPAGGDVLPDGHLVLADANADPLELGDDGTGKGVYGTGRGALLAVDPDAGTVETLLASDRFVSPVVVRRVR